MMYVKTEGRLENTKGSISSSLSFPIRHLFLMWSLDRSTEHRSSKWEPAYLPRAANDTVSAHMGNSLTCCWDFSNVFWILLNLDSSNCTHHVLIPLEELRKFICVTSEHSALRSLVNSVA